MRETVGNFLLNRQQQESTVKKVLCSIHPSLAKLHTTQSNPLGNVLYQQAPSLAETTMLKYCGTPSSANRPPVETKVHPQTGKLHPYDPVRQYLRIYPVDFRGCLSCGATDHWSTQDCPRTKNETWDKKELFAELWAHKPPHDKQITLLHLHPITPTVTPTIS